MKDLTRRDLLKGTALAVVAPVPILAFEPRQPVPTSLWLHRHGIGPDVSTVIARTWAPGDVAKCRLCPKGRCNADPAGRACMIVAARFVEAKDAGLYRYQGEGEVSR